MFDFEVIGPIARDVAGVRAMFEILAPDARSANTPPKRARILFVERLGTAPVDQIILDRCREAATWLRQLGHEVTTGPLPFGVDTANLVFQQIVNTGLAMLARREPRFFELSAPDFAEQAQQGAHVTGGEYADMLQTLFSFRATVAQAFENIDVIMTPATAAQPWPAEQPYPPAIAGQPVGPRGHAVFTGWVNVCGHPAIAVPAHPDHDGMPIGFQLVGAPRADELLLDIAEEFEAAHPFTDRWPEFALG
jgi:aspartyl-tRNA(Asn)/glutamyl-tRNA(Gln) amidotransferase subunit A